jgi:hypothetical protein
MTNISSPLTRSVARQCDLFQNSLESAGTQVPQLRLHDFRRGRSARQQQLSRSVPRGRDRRGRRHRRRGFGSGERDFVFARTSSSRASSAATSRAAGTRTRARSVKADRRLGSAREAETLPGLEAASVDKLAIGARSISIVRSGVRRRS